MKQIVTIITLALLVVNTLCGWLISVYGWFNLAMSSTVIALTGTLLTMLWHVNMRDGFKISLTGVYSICGLVGTVLAIVMPCDLADNWILVATVLIMFFQLLTFLVCFMVSNQIR